MTISTGISLKTPPIRAVSAPPVKGNAEVEPAESFAGTLPLCQSGPTPAVDSGALRKALGSFPTGVTVITTGEGDQRHGMTASSFNSVSLDPPLVLFSAGSQSGTLAALRENGSFAINLLAGDQSDLCYRFAKGTPAQRFEGLETRPAAATGSPVLKGSLGHFDCEVHQIVPAGDHCIVIGRVVSMEQTDAGEPLTFWGGKLQSTAGWVRK